MKKQNFFKGLTCFLFSVSLLGCATGMGISYSSSATKVKTKEYLGVQVAVHAINPVTIERNRRHDKALLPNEFITKPESPQSYKLGVNDIVAVTVWEHPELTQPLGEYRSDIVTGQVIESDGTMFYPYVGKIKAEGLTREGLRRIITWELSKTLENPQVDIKVLAYRSKKVYVGGEVQQPGMKAITDEPMTLPEALSRAGGFTSNANAGDLWLTRNGKTYSVDFLSMYRTGNPLDKLYLLSGDKIHVPSREENKVYVLGEVVKPQGVSMEHGRLSLTQALGEVGGVFETTADADAIYVVRGGQGRQGIDVFHLSAKNPVALVLADQFQLHPRDVIYVDNTGLVGWNRFITLILPTATLISESAAAASDFDALDGIEFYDN